METTRIVFITLSTLALVICLVFWGTSFYMFYKRYRIRRTNYDGAFGKTISDKNMKLTWWQKNGGYLLFVSGLMILLFSVAGFASLANL
ncbi:MPN207a family PTS transporter accessory protein [Mycoplasma tullyi]|uniref:MPN207a family PTS transporter accessory protein n=1 Tax=Mycoplasma tullyi TaxID=1612150 RepID=UPI003898DEA4